MCLNLLFSDTKEFIASEVGKVFLLVVIVALIFVGIAFFLHIEINHVEELLVARSMLGI